MFTTVLTSDELTLLECAVESLVDDTEALEQVLIWDTDRVVTNAFDVACTLADKLAQLRKELAVRAPNGVVSMIIPEP